MLRRHVGTSSGAHAHFSSAVFPHSSLNVARSYRIRSNRISDRNDGHTGDGWMEYRRSEDGGRTPGFSPEHIQRARGPGGHYGPIGRGLRTFLLRQRHHVIERFSPVALRGKPKDEPSHGRKPHGQHRNAGSRPVMQYIQTREPPVYQRGRREQGEFSFSSMVRTADGAQVLPPGDLMPSSFRRCAIFV